MGRLSAYFSFSRSLFRFAVGGLVITAILFVAFVLREEVVVDREAELIIDYGDAIGSGDEGLIAEHPTSDVVAQIREYSVATITAVAVAFVVFYGAAVLFFSFEENRRRLLEERITSIQRFEHLALLAAGTAHDFNNMLMAIAGNAALARAEARDDSPIQLYLGEIEFAIERASELTRQLQHYAGGGAQVVESVDLNALLTETVRVLRPTFGEGITVEVESEEGLPEIQADSAQARQVILNLIRNAVDSLETDEAGGKLTLSTKETNFNGEVVGAHVVCAAGLEPGRFVSIRFSDTGAGIPKAALSSIFNPYFSSKGAGRGLGLAAVAGIIRQHRGAVSVHSKEGRGTTFEVFFPRPRKPAERPSAAPSRAEQAL